MTKSFRGCSEVVERENITNVPAWPFAQNPASKRLNGIIGLFTACVDTLRVETSTHIPALNSTLGSVMSPPTKFERFNSTQYATNSASMSHGR